MDATVGLVTEDGQRVFVDRRVAEMMGILQPLLAMHAASAELSLPLPMVKSPVLAKVVEFLAHHKDDANAAAQKAQQTEQRAAQPGDSSMDEDDSLNSDASSDSPLPSDDETLFADYVAHTTPWDQKFMDGLDLPTLVEVTKAANYLNIPALLDLCCRTIARQMTGLKAHELREKFNLPNDFTPEEEARMAAEFAWVDE